MTTKIDKAWECEKIRDLLARYCERLDEYDIDAVAQCFSEDAVTDYGAGRGGEITGRATIAKRIATGQRKFRRTHHQLGQVRIRLHDDGAETTSYMTTWHELASGKIDIVCLRYLDRLRHADGEWLIYHRRVEVTLVDGFEGTEWSWVERNIPLVNN
jgi:ketosteroid isomerase-like protein